MSLPLALLLAAAAPADAIAARHGFAGEILTVRGTRVDDRAYGGARPGARRALGDIAGQLLAVLAWREVAAGRAKPDAAAVPTRGLPPALAGKDLAALLRTLPGDAAARDDGIDATLFGLLAFDTGLARGRLLPPATRDAMWAAGDGQGAVALDLPGCAAPVRVVAAGDEAARNYVLPDTGDVLIVFAEKASAPLGQPDEPGLVRDLLAAVACPGAAS